MSTILDRARAMFAAAVAAVAGQPTKFATRATWAQFNGRLARYQHSHRTVAQDKRAARKARNVLRHRAHT